MSNVTATTFTFLGGLFKIGDGATPENFTAINQITSCDFSGTKVDHNDVTSADNTDGTKRFADALFDPGDCTVALEWNPNDATHQQLHAAFLVRGLHNFQRTNAGGFGTRNFAGIILSFDVKQPLDKPATATVKIKLSGPYTGA